MNTEQFGGRNYGNFSGVPYHAVVGRDGLFRSEPLVTGTVVQTADGGKMWDGADWRALPGSWGSGKHLTAAELEKLMKQLKPSAEEISRLLDEDIKKAMEPEPKFHFESF